MIVGKAAVPGSSALEQAKAALSAKAGTAAPGAPETAGTTDSTSISALGKALKGMAAEAFQYLDNETKGKLEKAVNDGRVSADDVVNGLRYMARNSLFHQRYVKEAPRTPDQVQASRDAGLAAVSLNSPEAFGGGN